MTRTFPDPAVVLLTDAGHRLEDERTRQELGVRRCLTKPVKHSDLFKAVLDALGAARASWSDGRAATRDRLRPVACKSCWRRTTRSIRNWPSRLLEKQGHAVTVVGNGREALAALEGADFDVVLMDVSMPEMDGLEATAASPAARGREATAGACRSSP